MANVERQLGRKPKELEDLIELPEPVKECWYWFLALNSTRASGFGMSPISYTEMHHFFMLKGIEPSEQEIDVIKMFDHIAIEFSAKQQQKNNKNNK